MSRYPIDAIIAALRASEGQLSATEAAGLIFRSPRRFRSIVRESTGTNYRTFRLRIKLELAKCLLRESELSISDISDRLCYASRDKFERVFKRHLELTPCEYRAIHRNHRATSLSQNSHSGHRQASIVPGIVPTNNKPD